ncbi:hypothetical protein PROFUN_12182 [Planoprotostelium fungivorum]|uniref:Uncharacterized protein n=1 Tax=Planoprotostelium fungivorum TaxID=1890364 RepID=A0A2P6N8G7_9EUKA|nr:hypothetical protein PROFUN_12182 [Planoprotostelium fungivorum]
MTVFKMRYEGEIRRFKLEAPDISLINLKAFAANYFHLDPRIIGFKHEQSSISTQEQLTALTSSQPASCDARAINLAVELHQNRSQPAPVVQNVIPPTAEHHTQTLLTNTDNNATQTLQTNTDNNGTQTLSPSTDSSSSQTHAPLMKEHQTQTKVDSPLPVKKVDKRDELEDEQNNKIRSLEDKIDRLEIALEESMGEIRRLKKKVEEGVDVQRLVTEALNSEAFHQALREHVHATVALREPVAPREDSREHYPAPPQLEVLRESHMQQDGGVNKTSNQHGDSSDEYASPIEEMQVCHKSEGGSIINSLLSFLKPSEVQEKKEDTPQTNKEDEGDIQEMKKKLNDMGFTDDAINDQVVRFHWVYGERELDSMVAELLQRQN